MGKNLMNAIIDRVNSDDYKKNVKKLFSEKFNFIYIQNRNNKTLVDKINTKTGEIVTGKFVNEEFVKSKLEKGYLE